MFTVLGYVIHSININDHIALEQDVCCFFTRQVLYSSDWLIPRLFDNLIAASCACVVTFFVILSPAGQKGHGRDVGRLAAHVVQAFMQDWLTRRWSEVKANPAEAFRTLFAEVKTRPTTVLLLLLLFFLFIIIFII